MHARRPTARDPHLRSRRRVARRVLAHSRLPPSGTLPRDACSRACRRSRRRSNRARVEVVPVPFDCRDGFFCAYWRRPHAYLDPEVRASISALALLDDAVLEPGLARLEADLRSGAWHERNREPPRTRGVRLRLPPRRHVNGPRCRRGGVVRPGNSAGSAKVVPYVSRNRGESMCEVHARLKHPYGCALLVVVDLEMVVQHARRGARSERPARGNCARSARRRRSARSRVVGSPVPVASLYAERVR